MSDKVLDAFFKTYADNDEEFYSIAADTNYKKLDVIDSGSPSLNDALSCGGLPLGRIIQFYGAGGSGKTLMSMIAMKNAQKLDPNAKQMFINSEGTFDRKWARQIGVDLSKVVLINEEKAVNGRDLFEMLLGVPKEDKQHRFIGKSKKGFLDLVIEKQINCNLIVLDSLGAIIPAGEDVSEVGKMNIALLPRFLSTVLKKLSLEVNKANLCFIAINHQKATMDPYGADHTYSGGNSYSHFLSANVYFKPRMGKDAQLLDDREEKIGHSIVAKIEKSKFGPWPREAEFKVDFSKGIINAHEELAKIAVKWGVVTRPNNVMYEYEGNSWRGQQAFFDALKENADLLKNISMKIDEVRHADLTKLSSTSDAKEKEADNDLINEFNTIEEENEETPKRGRKRKD